jgi:hypothetical protein
MLSSLQYIHSIQMVLRTKPSACEHCGANPQKRRDIERHMRACHPEQKDKTGRDEGMHVPLQVLFIPNSLYLDPPTHIDAVDEDVNENNGV